MKNLIAVVALLASIAQAAATGLNITGTIAGVLIDVVTDGSSSAVPAVSSCGSGPALLNGAKDNAFTVIPGSGATSCTITLGGTYVNTPTGIPAAENGTAVTWSWSQSTTSFDPANTGSSITLSNGNLTANMAPNIGTWNFARSLSSHSSGKYYLEMSSVADSNGASVGIGFVNTAASVGNFPGVDTNGVFLESNGAVYFNNAVLTTVYACAQGCLFQMALDIDNKFVWFRGNASTWNNSGTANPATGVGGISIASVAAGPYFAAGVVDSGTGTQHNIVTANFGGTTFTNTAPAGFALW